MNEQRQQLLQTYVRSLHRFMRLMGSTVLCPGSEPKIPKSQLLVLYVLLEDKKLTVKDIAAQLSITSSAATQLVEHLVQTGLVERTEDRSDRRAVDVQLTAEGVRETVSYQQKLLKRLDSVFMQVSNEALEEIIEFQDNVITKEQE